MFWGRDREQKGVEIRIYSRETTLSTKEIKMAEKKLRAYRVRFEKAPGTGTPYGVMSMEVVVPGFSSDDAVFRAEKQRDSEGYGYLGAVGFTAPEAVKAV